MLQGQRMRTLFAGLCIFSLVSTRCERNEFRSAVDRARVEKKGELHESQEGLPFFTGKDLNPTWDSRGENLLRIPAFRFTDQNGQTFTQKNLENKITIVNFFFAHCPGICPIMMKNLKALSRKIRNPRLQFVSHSVTPWLDDVNALRRYGKKQRLPLRNWHLTTGDKMETVMLAREIYQADVNTGEKKSPDEVIHSEHVYLVDQNRYVRGIYNGNRPESLQLLIQDIHHLEVKK